MQTMIGARTQDLRRRPLVLTPVVVPASEPTGLVTAVKDAALRGADLVIVPWQVLTAADLDILRAQRVGWAGRADDATEWTPLIAGHADAVLWSAPVPPPSPPGPGVEEPLVLASEPAGRRPGDGLVIDELDVGGSGGFPDDGPGIVDLSAVNGRAELTALVTVALEYGAAGFITTSPSTVRRAAHVIRAVEHAR